MKVNSNLITITLGIIFVFSSILITTNVSLNDGLRDKWEDRSYIIDLKNDELKMSKVSEPIYINDNDPSSNWSVAKEAGICTGFGTYSEPYVIKDLVIDGGGLGSCIFINNSNVYFKIKNCTLFNSPRTSIGIQFTNVTNSLIIDNNCSLNQVGILLNRSKNNFIFGNDVSSNSLYGIVLHWSDNNTIMGNTVNDNSYGRGISMSYSNDNNILENIACYNGNTGIYLILCDNNTISGNIANENNYPNNPDRTSGIDLTWSDNNTISGNIANNHIDYGIYLYVSDNNTISGNTLLGNNDCIHEYECSGNFFENNNCGQDQIIHGNNFLILLYIIFVGVIISVRKTKKS